MSESEPVMPEDDSAFSFSIFEFISKEISIREEIWQEISGRRSLCLVCLVTRSKSVIFILMVVPPEARFKTFFSRHYVSYSFLTLISAIFLLNPHGSSRHPLCTLFNL